MRSWWSNLKQGVAQCWYWFPVIWRTRDWDWAYLAEMLEHKIRRMEASTKHWHVKGAEKDARQMRVCALLLKRLRKDDYCFECGPNPWDYEKDEHPPQAGRDSLKITYNIADQDMDLLLRTLRHMRGWWD